jgi:hypothetical protein
MKHYMTLAVALVATVMMSVPAMAQGVFKVDMGKAFTRAIPKDFYLEGNAIPTEKRNSALVMTPSGNRLVVGLIDTAGYSSRIQQKYIGMLISEGQVGVCGNSVSIGSYGFGLAKPGVASGNEGAKLMLYDQGGHKVAECTTNWDAKLEHPSPLHVTVEGGVSARLYLGRNWVELK